MVVLSDGAVVDSSIDQGGAQLAVTEEALYGSDRATGVEELSGIGMA